MPRRRAGRRQRTRNRTRRRRARAHPRQPRGQARPAKADVRPNPRPQDEPATEKVSPHECRWGNPEQSAAGRDAPAAAAPAPRPRRRPKPRGATIVAAISIMAVGAGPAAARRRLFVADRRPLRVDRQRLRPAGPGDDQRRTSPAASSRSTPGENDTVAAGDVLFGSTPSPTASRSPAPKPPSPRRASRSSRCAPPTSRRSPRTRRRTDDVDFKPEGLRPPAGPARQGRRLAGQPTTRPRTTCTPPSRPWRKPEQNVAAALAALGGDPSIETDDHPLVLAALAKRDQAALDLANTTVERPGRRRRRPGRPPAGRPVGRRPRPR